MANLVNLLNVLTFTALMFATYAIFYFGLKLTPDKKININIFMLSLGINLIGLSHLFRLWAGGELFTAATLAIGSIFAFIGIITTFHQKSIETANLRKREEEIKSIIGALKEKYYWQEISEEELKSIHTSLLKELAEIEVKLKAGEKEKPSK